MMMANPAPGFMKHPHHEVRVEQHAGEVVALIGACEIARSQDALKVTESRYDPVFYFPLRDVKQDMFSKTDHTTYCPFKGKAGYWTIDCPEGRFENAVWGYDTPYDETRALAGHVAFYADRVTVKTG